MKISAINNAQNFRGLITLQGPDPKLAVTVNTDNISTIRPAVYLGQWFSRQEGSEIITSDGSRISTYVPRQVIADAYKQTVQTGETSVSTPYNPLVTRGLFA